MASNPPSQVIAKIFVRDAMFSAYVGIYPHEHEFRQNIMVNIELWVDIREALLSENIDDTVNYVAIRAAISDLVADRKFILLETLVNTIVELCFTYAHVERVSVRAEKPSILPYTQGAGVEIDRESRLT